MSNPNIKFYRSNQAPANPVEGFIWFKTDDRTIKLYKNNDWETYSGIVGAAYDEENYLLTITPASGEPVVVNLGVIGTLETEVKKLEGIQDKVTTYVVTAIKTETTNREAADKAINDILNGTKNDDGSENTKGLVKEVEALRAEMNALGGIDGGDGIGGMIDAKINALDLPNTYETKGAAADALDDAKAYADSLAANYDAAGTAAGLDAAMDVRVKVLEGIDHDKLAADAAAAALNEFATKVSNDQVVNTYKELVDYAAEHGSEFTTLVGVVEGKADKTYVDGLAANYEVAGAANQALVDAKSYTDEEIGKLSFDAAGSAAAAEAAAKTYADGLKTAIDGVIEENERVTAASLTDLDSRIVTLESVDHDAYVGADETVLSNAKTYADNLFTWAEY